MDINPSVQSSASVRGQRADDLNSFVRLNQRFSAEVLSVAGERIVLSVQGVPIVARMAASNQTNELINQKTAQFIVRDVTRDAITVQFIQPKQAGSTGSSTGSTSRAEVTQRLLQNSGIEVNEETTMIGRALLGRGVPVDADAVQEMRDVLSQLGSWGAKEADTAASLKSAGLPLTKGSLSLASESSTAQMNSAIHEMEKQLQTLAKNNPQIAGLVGDANKFFDSISVSWTKNNAHTPADLQQAISSLNQTMEGELARLIQQGTINPAGNLPLTAMLTLEKLRQEVAGGAFSPATLQALQQQLQQTAAAYPEISNAVQEMLKAIQGFSASLANAAGAIPPELQKMLLTSGSMLADEIGRMIRQGTLNPNASLPQDVMQALASLKQMLGENASILQINEAVRNLQGMLRQLSGQVPGLSGFSAEIMRTLDALNFSLTHNASNLLRQTLAGLNPALEGDLARLAQRGIDSANASLPQEGILVLAKLRQALSQNNQSGLVEKLDQFLDTLRFHQLLNADLPVPEDRQALMLEIPLNVQDDRAAAEQALSSRIRVAFKREGKGRKADPNFTSMAIQIDIAEGETIQIDLSVVHRQISAMITTPTPQLERIAREELPALSSGLREVGYSLQTSHFEMRQPPPLTGIETSYTDPAVFHSVDLDI